jgi:uncharacterized protein (TIGR00255 family)
MTGFGSAEVGSFRVEIRSLNHRYMDAAVRVPSTMARAEMLLRDKLKKNFLRGKFDVFVNLAGSGEMKVHLDKDIAREIYTSLNSLGAELGLEGEVSLDSLLRWKDSFMQEEVTFDESELFEAFDIAVEGLKGMRQKEGKALAAEISGIAGSIESRNNEISEMCPAIMGECRKKFNDRLKDLFKDGEVDEGKLLQEAAQLVEKSDITEELARIRSHVDQMRHILSDGEAVGRKLDFLLQELNREVNTIASKTGDQTVLSHVIDMKAEIERAREQAQNLQ